MPKIETLIDDIYSLFDFGKTVSDDDAAELGKSVATIIQSRLADYSAERTPTLRMSNLGKPDRQLWYEINYTGKAELLGPTTKIKFLFGDIWESVLLFLAKQSGHLVSHEQHEVILDNISGHPDAVIDGVVVDVKSASSYAFKKFKEGTLKDDDPFGYYAQLAGYVEALDPEADAAFLAVNKESGALTLLPVPNSVVKSESIRQRIVHIKEVVAQDTPPPRCYEPIPEGKSGNLKLATVCSYCKFKQHCWSDANEGRGLRMFMYHGGPMWLTNVAREPNVPEVSV